MNSRPHLVLHSSFLETKVADLKPRTAHCLPLRASVLDAVKLFSTAKVGSVFVLDDEDRLKGIFTERDLVTKFHPGKSLKDIKISDVMTYPVEHMRSSSSLVRLLELFNGRGIRHVVIADWHGKIARALSARDVIEYVYASITRPETGRPGNEIVAPEEVQRFFDLPVSALKPKAPVVLKMSDTILAAVRALKEFEVGAVCLIDEHSSLAGIFSERDLALRVFAKEIDPGVSQLKDVMTTNPTCVSESSPLSKIFNLMAVSGFRHVPLLGTKGQLTGMVSIKDLMKHLGENA